MVEGSNQNHLNHKYIVVELRENYGTKVGPDRWT